MIFYFMDRQFNIATFASTDLPEGLRISSDKVVEDIQTGVNTLDCQIKWYDNSDYEALKIGTTPGNFLLKTRGYDPKKTKTQDVYDEFYTIIDREINSTNHSITLYCEDAGLDLINQIAPAYTATSAHNIIWYINHFVSGTGWEVNDNDAPTSTLTLKWDGQDTLTKRLASIANSFKKCEIYYTFEIEQMRVTHKYINVARNRGQNDPSIRLRINEEVDVIKIKDSVANLATAFNCTGGTPSGSSTPITLEGYDYPQDADGFYVSGRLLCNKLAQDKWSSLLDSDGLLVNQYKYETTSQRTLCSHAISELRKVMDLQTSYDVDIKVLDENLRVGDRVYLIDHQDGLYIDARIVKMETSITSRTRRATLDEYKEIEVEEDE